MKLSELCDIQTGIIMSRTRGSASSKSIGTMRVLVPKAIENGYINDKDIIEKKYSKIVNESFFTHEGDVILKLSSPFDFCYIDKEHTDLLVNSFCCRIVPSNPELSWYIMAFLTSDSFKNQIVKNCAGALTAIVRVSSIRNLELPNFDKERALEIGAKFKKLTEIRKTVDEIYKWELVNNSIEFAKECN